MELTVIPDNESHKLSFFTILSWWLPVESKSIILFLALLPLGLCILSWAAGTTNFPTSLIVVVSVAFLVMGCLLLLSLKRRGNCPIVVVRRAEGLELQSLFSKCKLVWADIREIIEVSDDAYLLETRHGNILLSKRLTDFQALYEAIASRMPASEVAYNFNSFIDDDMIVRVTSCTAGIALAIFSHFMTQPGKDNALLLCAATTLVIPVLSALLFLNRVPQLLRISKDGILVRTFNGKSKSISWHQLHKVQQPSSNLTVLSTDYGWFVLMQHMMSRKKQVKEKFLECQISLPALRSGTK